MNMPRNFHFELIAIFFSALIHAAVAVPYLSGKFTTTSNKQATTPLQLSMFKTVPEPVQAIIPEVVKPVTPPAKPIEPKPLVKNKPAPIVKSSPKPPIKPLQEVKIKQPEPKIEPPPEIVQAAPPTQPEAPIEAEPEKMIHDLGLIARLEDEYRLTLSRLIDASKDYPRRAQRRNIEGKAIVSFIVLRDGTVEQIRIIDSTGHQMLDKAVVQAIEAVSGKLPLPEELKRQQWQFKIPLSFSLS